MEPGLLTLLGVAPGDTLADAEWLAEKMVGLRVFEDESGKMNRSLLDIGGAMLIVSQFTLFGDARKGRRPSFTGAAPPAVAIPLYEGFIRGGAETRHCGQNGRVWGGDAGRSGE